MNNANVSDAHFSGTAEDRAGLVAAIRALADHIEANPTLPLPRFVLAQATLPAGSDVNAVYIAAQTMGTAWNSAAGATWTRRYFEDNDRISVRYVVRHEKVGTAPAYMPRHHAHEVSTYADIAAGRPKFLPGLRLDTAGYVSEPGEFGPHAESTDGPGGHADTWQTAFEAARENGDSWVDACRYADLKTQQEA